MKPVTDDDLLSYLDQEVDAETRQRIEQRLKEESSTAPTLRSSLLLIGAGLGLLLGY